MNVTALTAPEAQSRATPGLPRLLAGVSERGAMSLHEHLAVHGQAPFARGRRERRAASELIEQVKRADLRGRGGAGFPTAVKMRAVADARGRAVVVANAAEGEPASFKDRTLMELTPHLVLDGGVLAAQAVGAEELIVCLPESASAGLDSVELAIAERRDRANSSPGLRLAAVPESYIAGQESALINHLNGGPATPTFTPPMPFQRGVGRRPTLLNNAETLAHIALIARHGPDWFRWLGTEAQPGSTLITISGAVVYPGVYEIEHGAPLSSLIEAAGGPTTTMPVRAALLGGYAGTWIDGDLLPGLELCDEQLAPHGASLGAGVVVLLGEHACGVAETVAVTRWLADQSAGQCGPCVHGLDALASAVEQLAAGAVQTQAPQHIARLTSLVNRRGACGHPDGAVRFLTSALEVFSEEFSDHARHGLCEACAQPRALALPGHSRPSGDL
jgi:NADH:ubiquinone oxidoreductase subunit F (NADH-binding)